MGQGGRSGRSESETDETSPSNKLPVSRRQIIQGITGVGAFSIGTATGGGQAVAVSKELGILESGSEALTTSDPLLQEDFENYSVGSFPNRWSRSGNNNQQVVDSPAASGDQALEMIGDYGGCWQALAHVEFASGVPSDQTLLFSGHIHPTGTGGSGCHGNKNGNLVLQDSPSTSTGTDHRRKLIQFKADGTVSGSGLNLGSCQVGSYNSFEITYHWNSSAETVEVSYTINGQSRGNTTVDATTDDSGMVVESELVYLTVISGDYKLFVDNLLVEANQREENTPPNAVFTYTPEDPVIGDTITFDASGSFDPDGNIETYEWQFGAGEDFISRSSPTIQAEAVPPADTTEVTLRVIDDDGDTDTHTESVTVTEGGEPEITLEMSGDEVEPGDTARLQFTVENTGDAPLGSSDEGYPQIAYDYQGASSFTPRDWSGIHQEVTGGTIDPPTWYGNDSIDPGESITFDAEFDLSSDAEPGDYVFEGNVWQNDRETSLASATAIITVEEAGEPEFEFTAEASPETVAPGEETTLEFTITNVGDAVSESDDLYAWLGEEQEFETAFPNRGPFEISSHNDDNGTWDFGWLYDSISPGETRTPSIDVAVAESASPGEYTFALENIYADEDPATATVTITVAQDNTPPNATFTVSPENLTVGDTLTFDASGSTDPDGTIETYEWDLDGIGRGSAARYGPVTTVTAMEVGRFNITLTVTDNDGASASLTEQVHVTEGMPGSYNRVRENKLEVARSIDAASVTDLGEEQAAVNVLQSYETAYNNGDFATEEHLTEAVNTLRFGEQIQQTLLEQTGEAGNETTGDSQIAVQATHYTIRSALSLLVAGMTFEVFSARTNLGDRIPDPAVEGISSIVKDILDGLFTQAVSSEAFQQLQTAALKAVNYSLDGEFASSAEFESFIGDSITSTVANISLQREIEQGGYPPLSITNPKSNVALDLFSVEDTLEFVHSELRAEGVTPLGPSGSYEQRIDLVASVENTLQSASSKLEAVFNNLDDILSKINILSNAYSVLTKLRNENESLQWEDFAGAIGALVPHAGLVVAAFRALGSYATRTAIQVLVTISAFGTATVIDADPTGLVEPEDLLPDVDATVGRLDTITSVWGGVQ